ILEDFSDEKTRLQSTQSAVLNILEDFSDEKVRLQSTQSAVLNILEDFSSEKGRLQDMQRAVINILDDLQGDNQKLTVAQRSLTLLTTDLESRVRQRTEELSDVNVALRTKAEQLSSASKYKSEFLANMSHELRTPLNSILLLAKLLADNDDGNLTTKQEQYANVIVSAGTDLLALISDILDLSKIEAGKMEIEATSFDIDALLQHLRENFEPVARVRGLEFIASRGRGVPSRVHTDRQRLEQVLRNLLSNAFKFTSAGRVSLHVGFPLAAGEQAFGQAGVDGRREFTFSVLDTGVGIAEDQQSLIFEAFRQADGTTSRKYGGTGLGLSISTSIAKLLGGNLDVASVPGRGSLFTLTIPHGPSAATQVTAPT
ncbi:MAG: ATP-binding protein, partial [Gemmatimonadota bacterium]